MSGQRPDFFVVIPARYGSSRLPGKPLADLAGQPMIVRVVRRAMAAGASEVVVAADDERVCAAVGAAGGTALLTRTDHPSGSDRVMEVVERRGWPDDALVVNVQGDEPLIPPQVIDQVANLLRDDTTVGVATLSEPLTDLARVFDPNVVKVVADHAGRALYFSRAPIPYARDAFPAALAATPSSVVPEPGGWHRHIGIYAYRVAVLRRFVGMPVGRLEALESLEQLRLLEAGIGIRVAAATAAVPAGVDTATDLQRVRELLAAS